MPRGRNNKVTKRIGNKEKRTRVDGNKKSRTPSYTREQKPSSVKDFQMQTEEVEKDHTHVLQYDNRMV